MPNKHVLQTHRQVSFASNLAPAKCGAYEAVMQILAERTTRAPWVTARQ